ncbi:MAG: glycosyltransferase [Planctomycetota bacterium]
MAGAGGLRLGLVVHGQPPELVGGTELLVADLARGLVGQGATVEIFSGSIEWRERFEVVRDRSGAVPVVRVHRSDLFFERWDKLRNPFVERAYHEWLTAFRPQLVHVHHWARLSTRLVAGARARGLPVALTLHDLLASCPRYHRIKEDLSYCEAPPSPAECRHCAPRWPHQGDAEIDAALKAFIADLRHEVQSADALLAPTAGHAARVLGALGLGEAGLAAPGPLPRREAGRALGREPGHAKPASGRPVTVLPPASETELRPALRPLGSGPASAATPLRVGVFGHLHPLKGVEVLLDAQALLPDPSAVELHVWGAAPTPEMETALRARAGARRVIWHGRYRPHELAGASIDVAVLPTLCAESYSFALDEAAALRVPIVATNLGALADRATPRLLLFPRGDAAELARLLTRLGAEPALRERLVGAPAPARLGMAAHLAALVSIYEGLVRQDARPAGAGLLRRSADEEAALSAAEADFLRREEALQRGLSGG